MDYVAYLVLRRLRAPLIALIVVWSLAVLGYVLIPGVDNAGQPYRMDFLHAFYFVSYMGSTIGFGEIPYAFTPAQRYWTIFSIYATVICWFYSIGAVVTIFQDKGFLNLMQHTRFRRRVAKLKDPFFLVCGYGMTGSALVADLSQHGIHVVVVDSDQARIDALELDNHPFDIPRLCADAGDPQVLRDAGVQHVCCQGVLCVTNQDSVNLYVSIASKVLAPARLVISRVSSRETAESLQPFQVDHVVDPFETFAGYLVSMIVTPYQQMVQEWLINPQHRPAEGAGRAQAGRWIICGYGRFGQALQRRLEAAGLMAVVIDPDPTEEEREQCRIVAGKGTDAASLLEAGVRQAVGIVAGAPEDAINLAILKKARELNPAIVTVARQNRPADAGLFRVANMDFTMDPNLIIAQRIAALIKTPLLQRFLTQLPVLAETDCQALLQQFDRMVHDQPLESQALELVPAEAPALHELLQQGQAVALSLLLADPLARERELPLRALLLVRADDARLLPSPDTLLRAGDRILLCGRVAAFRSLAWTLNNENVLRYVHSGSEGASGYLWKRMFGRRS